ncbi:MAG: hypothetical protein Q9216_000444 [Gyalolechia sp. 2 TL-2023]
MNNNSTIVDDTLAFKHVVEAVDFLVKQLPPTLRTPKLGIVCGSGLGSLADSILPQPRHEIPYVAIPYFPSGSVNGHADKLVLGLMEADKSAVVFLVVTNAAGGLDPAYAVGDVVLLNDHLNLAGLAGNHPLRGPNLEHFGIRFPALSDAYDLDLRYRVHKIWQQMARSSKSRRLHEGTYAFVSGPSYETRAECRMLRIMGADLVGMSTVPEIVVARHCSMRIVAFSLVTNNAVLEPGIRGDDPGIKDPDRQALTRALAAGKANHEEVLRAGEEATKDLQVWGYPSPQRAG